MSELATWMGELDPVFRLLLLLPVLVVVAALARDRIVFTAFVALMGFWLLLSGYFTAFLLTAGVGSVTAVLLLARRMEVIDQEAVPVDFLRAIVGYWPWLMREIVISALTVTRIILDPRLPISPTMLRFRPAQRSELGLVTHANSITLTPGTITIDTARGEFLVHGLTNAGANGCVDSEMDRRIAALENAHTRRAGEPRQ